jgi:hypothetical protein
MVRPVRLQLSRRKGFDLQALSRETNGLEAVNVARPSRWGNPFKVGDPHPYALPEDLATEAGRREMAMDAQCCVDVYALSIATANLICDGRVTNELAGKNLACWCSTEPGTHCHADILLELANAAATPLSGRAER